MLTLKGTVLFYIKVEFKHFVIQYNPPGKAKRAYLSDGRSVIREDGILQSQRAYRRLTSWHEDGPMMSQSGAVHTVSLVDVGEGDNH